MSQEPEDIVGIETYSDLDRAAYDKEMLEEAGFHPSLNEEITEDSEHGYVLVLGVPHGEAERAYSLLLEYLHPDDQDEFKVDDNWNDTREEA